MKKSLLALLLISAFSVNASHIGDIQSLDEQVLTANTEFVKEYSEWKSSPKSVKDATVSRLLNTANNRLVLLEQLVNADPAVGSARVLPANIRNSLEKELGSSVERDVVINGKGHYLVEDDFEKGKSTSKLKVNDKLLKSTAEFSSTLLGKQGAFKGIQVGNTLLLDKVTLTEPSTIESLITGSKNTLSIIVSFTDAASPYTAAGVTNTIFGTAGTTVNTVYMANSRGKVNFVGKAVGPYLINYSSSVDCNYSGWAAAADAAAKANGTDPAGYAHVNYMLPRAPVCGWGGLAYMPGRQSWVVGNSVRILNHELGHNLSFHHASTLTSEYGDGSDFMGSASVGNNAANKVRAGWLPDTNILDVNSSGTYDLISSSDNTAIGVQVLRLAKSDSSEYYYVSTRTPISFDAPLSSTYTNNITVHKGGPNLPSKSYILANLLPGQSFNDVANGITLTANSGSQVTVTKTGPVCIPANPVVSLSPGSLTSSPGGNVTYNVSILNKDSPACPTGAFSLTSTMPAGFSTFLASNGINIAPGSVGTTTINVASSVGTPVGTYDVPVTASKGSYSFTGHASYVVYNDTVAPTVRFNSPAAGAVISSKKPISINVSGTDNIGVVGISAYVNNVLIGSSTTSSLVTNWKPARSEPRGLKTLKAVARDAAGNIAESSITITLN